MNQNENKMGVMPENRLLLSMSLPMMASMLVQALYNIVDSIFVSRVSEEALTAVSMAFPMQSLMIALGVGTTVGVNAILSKSLGQKDTKRVNLAAENGIFLSLFSYVVFLIIGLTLVKPFYLSQTEDVRIIEAGVDYLSVVLCASFGLFAQFIFERILTSTGRTVHAMITQATGAVVNLILDPIFIFGLGPIPAMEARGAAIATVIGQVAAGVLALILNLKKNPDVQLGFKGFRPDAKMIGEIYVIGVPTIIMQAIGSVMTYAFNQILIAFSATAVAVFGVYFKLQSFVFMPIFGLNNGLIPIVAFNYGAGRKDRMMKTWRLALVYAISVMVAGSICFELIPEILFSWFDASAQMLEIGVPALRIIGIHFPIAAFCIVTGAMFQALGKSIYSMITSIMRQLVVLLPAAYLLSLMGDVNYVWWAFPIAEIMSATVTVICFIILYRKLISKVKPTNCDC